MLLAVDYSTLFINAVSDAAASALAASGVGLAVLGFDTSQQSAQVRAAMVRAGLAIDVYRFIYWSQPLEPQIADVIAAIHQNPLPLPGYLWLDIEEEPNGAAAPPNLPAAIEQLMAIVEAAGVTPANLVKPGFYTRATYWNTYCPPGYTGPAQHGWALWTAEQVASPDQAMLYGGWRQDQVQGVQNRWDQRSPIGIVDYSVFRDRTPTPRPLAIASLVATMSDGSSRSLYP